MLGLLIAVSVVLLFVGAVYCVDRVLSFRHPALVSPKAEKVAEAVQEEQAEELEEAEDLRCRVVSQDERNGEEICEVLVVEIRGTVEAPQEACATKVSISVSDVTDGRRDPEPVYRRVKGRRPQELSSFSVHADMGKLPRKITVLSDWVCVGRIDPRWLLTARQGLRCLAFSASVLSRETGQELACAHCYFDQEIRQFGYIELEENAERTKMLAVPLAFAVCAADNNLADCQVDLIKNWARSNIDTAVVTQSAKKKLEKALKQAMGFFREGHRLDVRQICEELVEIASMAERYDILELCMRVAAADGCVHAEEVELLKDLAIWLEVDSERFHEMADALLPVSMHEVEDLEFILGVNSNMSAEEARQRLNREYRKWNARVTSPDAEVKEQADHMLNLIAEARAECIG